MITRTLAALVTVPLLLTGCSGGDDSASPTATATAAASAPAPGVTLPPDPLSGLVPAPAEVPAGMVLIPAGSGPRDVAVVASYSGSGATATAAKAALTAHGFVRAYVAQYVNPANGSVLSIVASTFRTSGGAVADFTADQASGRGRAVPAATVGEASSVTVQDVPGSVAGQLVILRFRRGTTTWSLAYKAAPTADPQVALDLARKVLERTAS